LYAEIGLSCCEDLEQLEVILKLTRELAHCAAAVENALLRPVIQITSLECDAGGREASA
jgi:hypothetical protein